jgi:hypothetical protein
MLSNQSNASGGSGDLPLVAAAPDGVAGRGQLQEKAENTGLTEFKLSFSARKHTVERCLQRE